MAIVHQALAKKLNDKIPKTIEETFERVRAFIRGEVTASSVEMVRPSQWDKGNVPFHRRRAMGKLKLYPLAEPVVYKRRPKTLNGRQALKERVFRWLKEGTIRKVSYGRRGILFHPHAERIKKLSGDTSKDDGKGLGRSKRVKRGSIPRRNSAEKQNRGRKVPRTFGDKGRNKSRPRKSAGNHPKPHPKRSNPNMKFIPATNNYRQTNEAGKALQRIKRKLNKLQTLAIPKEGGELMLCMRQRNETISFVLMVEREGVQAPVSYKGTNEGNFQSKDAEGSVMKKFFGQGEQRLYLGKKAIKEGSGVGIILVSLDEKMHSYAIRLKFNASDHAMDCEALLAGLVASISKGLKDLHVFIDSLTLVAQIEGNHTPATEQERKYKEEIMDATALFHRFQITHLPKILKSKTEVLTGLVTIKL
ncbi:reverse transcriptase domain-containing protein [Tanacetum coccineum]|uniref:Reverse transcriptase domain-containing protein n=1 Tax=Tanacetum coccineum TaxID=301880 RepID=A0ABQ5BRP9_9ASTR